jgi:hypothetical protein
MVSELINSEIAPQYADLTLKEAQAKYNQFEMFIIPKIKDVVLKVVRIEYK